MARFKSALSGNYGDFSCEVHGVGVSALTFCLFGPYAFEHSRIAGPASGVELDQPAGGHWMGCNPYRRAA